MNDIYSGLILLQHSLDYHLARHSLLASNVANAETPGYQPLDLRFDAYLARAGRLVTSHPAHVGASANDRFDLAVFADPAVAPGNDGNSVSMEREMAKLSANSVRYRAATEMLSRRIALLKYAATDGQRR